MKDKLLIVDDHPNIRSMLKRRLEKFDYDIIFAENAKDAYFLLNTTQVDIVLLDYMMPDMSGFDFFLDYNELKKIPAIMMTAHASLNLAIEFIKHGGSDFVEKPIDIDVLHIKLQRALSHDRMIKQNINEKDQAEQNLKEKNIQLNEKSQKLEELNQELENYVYTISHDLRAPLGQISMITDLLEKNKSIQNDDECAKYIASAKDIANKALQLSTEMLELAKLDSKEMVISPINTQKIVKEIAETLPFYNDKNKLITYEIEFLPPVYGDEVLIRQVFYNLIQNAVKYTSKVQQPTIKISSNILETEIQFIIIDNGVGFKLEDSNKLFNMFSRLHKNSDFEGTGVGLANVKKIVKKHNGRLGATSEIGVGSTFYFTIPIKKELKGLF